MARLRAAIIGYGRNGSSMHAGAIEQSEHFELAAACDIDPDRRRQAQERFGCRVYEDYREMLRAESLDLAIIVTRSDQHCEMTCDCLKAGVNVLVTKPWCVNEAEARRMIEAAQGSGRLLLPWLPARWGTDFTRLRELMAGGAIGRVFCVRRAAFGFGMRSDWQTERRYGGGYLLNWGPHLVDTAMLLAGGRARSACGWMKQVNDPGDGEDVFFALLRMDNETAVHVERSVAIKGLPDWFVQGDHGTIVAEGRQITVHAGEPPRPASPTDYAGAASAEPSVTTETVGPAVYGDEHEIYREVAIAVRGEREFPVTPADALELTRVLDAIRLSDREGRVVILR